MSPIQMLTKALRGLPRKVRTFLYAAFAAAGAFLGACEVLAVTSVGPIDVSTALQVCAYLSPIAGVVAVANVGRTEPAYDGAPTEDLIDLASFEPVGHAEDVYSGAAGW